MVGRRLFPALEGVALGNNNMMVQMKMVSLVTFKCLKLVVLECVHEREDGKFTSRTAKSIDLNCKQNVLRWMLCR